MSERQRVKRTLGLFMVFFLFLTITADQLSNNAFIGLPGSDLSIYKYDEPILGEGEDALTRGDVFDTVKILSFASFLVTFAYMVQKMRKQE